MPRSINSHIAKELFLCSLSAFLLILSFPRSDIWLFAFIGFVPLLFILENKSKVKAFLFAYLTGVIFWSGIIYWLAHVTLPGTIFLILYLALYFGVFGFLFSLVTGHWSLVTGPAIWVLLEYLRSHLLTGFPWALLGYSQYLNLPIIQIADITGAGGVSFLIMLANVAIFIIVSRQSSVVRKKQIYLLFLLCIFFVLGYGYYKLLHYRLTAIGYRLKVSVIQGNIPHELKWRSDSKDYIMNKYLNLTRMSSIDKPDLILWPEASLPVVLEEEPGFIEEVRSFAKEIKIPLLIGAVTKREGIYYNSAILFSAAGESLGRYDKLHLVPFGEYIPLKKYLPFLETIVPIGDINKGEEYTLFKLPITNYQLQITFSTLICFEDLFPELSREFVKRGAGFLVNITNDAWYKKTSAP